MSVTAEIGDGVKGSPKGLSQGWATTAAILGYTQES